MSDPSRVYICHRIAVAAPVTRIRALEFGHVRHGVGRNPHDLPLCLSFEGALAVKAPGNDQGIFSLCLGLVNVHIDRSAVTHLHRNVLHTDDPFLRAVGPLVQRRLDLCVLPLLQGHCLKFFLRAGSHHLCHDNLYLFPAHVHGFRNSFYFSHVWKPPRFSFSY